MFEFEKIQSHYFCDHVNHVKIIELETPNFCQLHNETSFPILVEICLQCRALCHLFQ